MEALRVAALVVGIVLMDVLDIVSTECGITSKLAQTKTDAGFPAFSEMDVR